MRLTARISRIEEKAPSRPREIAIVVETEDNVLVELEKKWLGGRLGPVLARIQVGSQVRVVHLVHLTHEEALRRP
jgi:hypothetical protein